ncbi:MerR family transcriptional regulator [Paenibacillus sacheonensis]|uniref:MerR family DNA-binding transcriptional regulator n=1 Tax=Paenibacillus sacheonensis TaxID=742054 RepID=A0A7X4YJU8_9BACL|nr:DNA-binding transcriptional MerR regulator [Paenibacillus sacheonensis]NBC67700.1 MerR family DNA-binding transcriptional regulator [Paenibacillus sacheonensis]
MEPVYYKPVEIARELGISTSALRHYEAWGVVPLPERAANGYRLYTKTHAAYFRCLRALFAGFGTAVGCEVLRHIQAGEMDAAFWLLNREQANLQEDKTVADRTMELLRNPGLPVIPGKLPKNVMTIGEAAELTGVPASAIRHWEREGLLQPERDPDNGYRLFNTTHIRQILLIRTLRRTVYFLEKMKEIVKAVEQHSLEKARSVTAEALQSIHARNRRQYDGAHQLVELCRAVGLIKETAGGKPVEIE